MSNADRPPSAADKPYARLEYLLDKITDRTLRSELERETGKIRMHKKFGLVFEEHLPEHVRLYQLPLQIGSKVVKRDGQGDDVFVVQSLAKEKTMIIHELDGHFEEADPAELVTIKKFGEPIYPSLIPVDRMTRAKDKPYHTIINAENFHALQLLLYCYEGQVDVIYIDPPYNTGARDWKYNNNFVDNNDQYRHSKWLSMMKRRLLLAKRLLRRDGVLIVTIDDYETHHLQMLLEEVFPERELTNVIIEHNPKGSPSKNFTYSHEYAHFMLPRNGAVIGTDPRTREDIRNLRRAGRASMRAERPTMFYPIYVKNGKVIRVGNPPTASFHPKSRNIRTVNGEIELWPIDDNAKERRWNFSRDSIEEQFERIEVRQQKNGIQLYVTANPSRYKTVWTGGEFDAGKYGTTLVKDILQKEFPFPKSLHATAHCIGSVARDRKNALILDFFAGSGTTLHATCLLNAEDGGNRQCILVTNNEVAEKTANELAEKSIYPGNPRFEKHGICESVTWPRCKNAVNGKRDDGTALPGEYPNGRKLSKGFDENIQYFRLDYLDPNNVAYREKLSDILPMLWLTAKAKGDFEGSKRKEQWFIPKHSPYAVLLEESAFAAFRKVLKERSDIAYVFLVTDSEEAYRDMCAELPKGIKAKMLYKSYLDNFRINIPLIV